MKNDNRKNFRGWLCAGALVMVLGGCEESGAAGGSAASQMGTVAGPMGMLPQGPAAATTAAVPAGAPNAGLSQNGDMAPVAAAPVTDMMVGAPAAPAAPGPNPAPELDGAAAPAPTMDGPSAGMLASPGDMATAMTDASVPDSMSPAEMEPEPVMREDLGEGDGDDVITIGDSWMDYAISGGGIEGGLARAGKDYRNYSLSGTRFLDGVIPRQYDRAKSQNPDITTVIMTGGGNDILLGRYSCDTAEQCQEFVSALMMGLNELWTKMSNDGVKDVIYINYSSDAGSGPADARPMGGTPSPEICMQGPIRCHNLATTDLVMGDLVDGIHPSRRANDRIAAAVIELMEAQGIRR